jgi:hypothetical protein
VQIQVNVNVNVTITHKFDWTPGFPGVTASDLEAFGERLMSVLSDKIDAVTTTTDAAIARVQADVTALTAKVAELQALVDSGGATPADLAALDALQAKLAALDPTAPDVLPTP